MQAIYSRGFHLIEVVVVLMILAILSTLAIPVGKDWLIKHRAAAQIQGLLHALHYARSEAVSRNEKISFCKSRNYRHCGGVWRDGQIIRTLSGEVLQVFSALPKTDNLIWNSSLDANDEIIFLPIGYTNGQRGTFYYCVGNQDVAHSINIVLLDTGRVYTEPMTTADYAQFCSK